MTVDYSASYRLSVNSTANWENGYARQQSHLHGVSFDDGQSNDVQMAFYFAIDRCPARYIAMFQLDQSLGRKVSAMSWSPSFLRCWPDLHPTGIIFCAFNRSSSGSSYVRVAFRALSSIRILYSAPNVSWIEDALRVLEENVELILVSPAFPGLSARKLRQRPTTRPMPKLNGSPLRGPVEAEDMTCQHPYTLPGPAVWVLRVIRCCRSRGRAILLDIERYQKLPARNNVKEHRCGGQLVRGAAEHDQHVMARVVDHSSSKYLHGMQGNARFKVNEDDAGNDLIPSR